MALTFLSPDEVDGVFSYTTQQAITAFQACTGSSGTGSPARGRWPRCRRPPSKQRRSWSVTFHEWLECAAYFVGGAALHAFPDAPCLPRFARLPPAARAGGTAGLRVRLGRDARPRVLRSPGTRRAPHAEAGRSPRCFGYGWIRNVLVITRPGSEKSWRVTPVT